MKERDPRHIKTYASRLLNYQEALIQFVWKGLLLRDAGERSVVISGVGFIFLGTTLHFPVVFFPSCFSGWVIGHFCFGQKWTLKYTVSYLTELHRRLVRSVKINAHLFTCTTTTKMCTKIHGIVFKIYRFNLTHISIMIIRQGTAFNSQFGLKVSLVSRKGPTVLFHWCSRH